MKDGLFIFGLVMFWISAAMGMTWIKQGKKKINDEGICGPARFETQPMRDLCLQVQTLGSEVAKLRSNQFNLKNPQPIQSRPISPRSEEVFGSGTFGPPTPEGEEFPETPEEEQ